MKLRRSRPHHNQLAAEGHAHIEHGIFLLEQATDRATEVRDAHDQLSNHHAARAGEAHADAEFHSDLGESVVNAFYGHLFGDAWLSPDDETLPEVES